MAGEQVNIVQVLNHGLLLYHASYYIDMELCDLNLDEYIHKNPPSTQSTSLPTFEREAGLTTLLQIWTVMSHIAGGIDYIHRKRHVHRDLKPANSKHTFFITYNLVLYSCKESLWKLADFGLVTEESSKTNLLTRYSRGTEGYRAPELMISGGDPAKYTNAVDIWAMGCILYELATATRRFRTDHDVTLYMYFRTNNKICLDASFDSNTQKIITRHVIDMLQIDATKRLPASMLFKEFCHQLQTVRGLIQLAMTDETKNAPMTPSTTPPHLIGKTLYDVAKDGDLEAVEAFLTANTDIHALGGFYGSALNAASCHGHEAVARLLLENGAGVDVKNDDGRTPLSWAAANGHSEVAKLLLQAGAEVDAEDKWGGTPLILAAMNGHSGVVELLLHAEAEVDAKDNEGWTPLISAAMNGHSWVVELLLHPEAEVDAKNDEGWTPLILAAMNGHSGVVELLLHAEAEVDAKDNKGRTPLSVAAWNGHSEVVELLEAWKQDSRSEGG